MPLKTGNGGHGQENYDPETGKYVSNENQFIGSDEDFDINDIEDEFADIDFDLDSLEDEFSDITVEDVEGFENELDKIFNKKTIDSSQQDDSKAVNPHYSDGAKYGPFQTNCQRCVVTYDLRRRGYDVEAKGRFDKMDKYAIGHAGYAGWFNFYKGITPNDVIKTGSKDKLMMIERTKSAISKMGDGARCIVRISWSKFSGHVLIAENINGQVKFIDPQDGSFYDKDYWVAWCQPTKTQIVRIDNKEINLDTIQDACKNRKGKK